MSYTSKSQLREKLLNSDSNHRRSLWLLVLAGGIAIANHIPATAPYQRSLKYVYIGLLWGWLAIQSLSNLNEWRKEHTLSSLDATAKAMAELSLFDW
ncbi:MAG: hypothetical protein ABEI86_12760, partial [Halobacteriaceae archaeon]